MLQNYLQNVGERFEKDKQSKNGNGGGGGGSETVKMSLGEESTSSRVDSSPPRQRCVDPSQQQQQQQQQRPNPNPTFSTGQNDRTTKADGVSSTTSSASTASSAAAAAKKPPPSGGNRIPCISNGCSLYGSSASSYLCNACFAKHKDEAVSVEKDIQLRGSNSRLDSPVKRQPQGSTQVSTTSGPKRAGSSGNLLAVRNSENGSAFSSLPRRK